MATTAPGESFSWDSEGGGGDIEHFFTLPGPTWADWRADERSRRVRRWSCFPRCQKSRCRCPRTGASRREASPPRPGFPCVPLREVPAPSPSQIPKNPEKTRGKGENRGAWLPEWNSSPTPTPLFFLSPPLQVISHYCRSFGEETKASPADGSVYPDPRCRWRKSLVGGTVPASSKLPLTSPPSSVRHFLETALFFCTYKSSPAPPPKLLYKKVDGYKQYGAPAQKLALFMPITHWNKLEICSTRQFSQYDHLIAWYR